MNHSLLDSLAVFGANYLYVLLLLIALIWYLTRPLEEKLEMIAWGIVALPVMYLLLIVAGMVYDDPRPFAVGHYTPLIPHDADNGFPSDHTLLCSATSSIVFFYSKRMSALLWALTALVGVSRVWTGLHHATDILASVIIAFAVTFAIWKLVLPILKNTAAFRAVYARASSILGTEAYTVNTES